VIDGYDKYDPNFSGDAPDAQAQIHVDYDIEGSDVGYRWFARQNAKPLFPFGFGLSYTTLPAAR
jgi:beta-glucosidase